MNYLTDIEIAPGGFKGYGLYGLEGYGAASGGQIFNIFISRAISIMTIVAFVWFVFSVFTGAIGIISSGGDKQALEAARKKIMTGIIGIVVVVSAIFIVSLIGQFLGIENILNPAVLIEKTTK